MKRKQCILLLLIGLLLMSGSMCHQPPHPQASNMHLSSDSAAFPYSPFRGLSDRQGDQIVDASAEDVQLAKSYGSFPDKGPDLDGMRLTILASKNSVTKGEIFHVLHFVEIVRPGAELYIMGPKEVHGLYIDDVLVGTAAPEPHYPWMGIYDGEVLPSPELDYNFEIGKYKLETTGEHRIQWRIDGHVSNTLYITVK